MTTPSPVLYPFPAELARIARDRSAVVEASAGTGKTFLIEHLVVDRLVRGDARLEEMLVVTFTDRAAAELRRRLRALVQKVARAAGAVDDAAFAWTIDAAARARLEAAARAVEAAPISTIHAFCQRVLTEQAFAGGRLLLQQSVESRAAFAAAFAEVLRQELAVDAAFAPYLEAYLARGGAAGSVDGLEGLLYRAHQLRAAWGTPFEPARIAEVARRLAALAPAELAAASAGLHAQTARAVDGRLALVHALARRFAADGDTARFLAALDVPAGKDDLLAFLVDRLGRRTASPVATLVEELAEVAVPLEAAVVQLFAPPVAARLAARKRAAGLYDFDDMLALVAEALAGPRGAELVATLRRRFKLAIVDEFQDTDPVQWAIFRTVFDERAERPLYLVGDPKQAIYGFRGADVATYARARDALAPAGEAHHLTRNFRSTRAVIDAYNAILDQTAAEPYFDRADVRYDPPVSFGGADEGSADGAPAAGPAVTLLRVTAGEEVSRLPMRSVREGLAQAVAAEIGRLLAEREAPRASEIFVLTRTWAEAKAAAAALAARGLPAIVYNQEGLYASPEARQVRDLLRAVADPHDPAKRLRAWLTPFFGLALADLPAAAAAGGDHPLYARLFGWHARAAREPLARLYARLLEESGVVLRECFLGESARRLTNFRHLFEVLAAEDARAARPLGEVVRRLSALCGKLLVPEAEEGNVQRLESERDAVQVMTMHKAKGLEAEVVFLYGGFSPSPNRGVRHYTTGGARLATAGRPRTNALADLIKGERASEDQRLFYVALTRARRRLYLPFSGEGESDAPLDGGTREVNWKLTGGYAHVNRRLRALRADEGQRRHFETRDVPIDPRATGDGGRPRLTLGLVGWRPEPERKAAAPGPELGRLAAERPGPRVTSYSRIKHAEGGYRPPTEIHDEAPDPAPLGDDELPGGARAGIFVHDLLERIPLETLRETADFEAWRARADVRALLEAALRRHGRDPRQLAAAARMAHAALTTPLPVVGGVLDGLPRAARVAREMEFLFPFPAGAGGADRGYVKGFVDLLFEHEGRVYFGDWKTDRLPGWDPAAVEGHVAQNYALQEQLYALALVRMLGVETAADHEARFGGTLYLFVRGLPATGAVRSRRPSFDELRTWEADIAEQLGAREEAEA
ncbi:MAG TPA: UvrD-helicase domain-containing protein [Polyangia bacterium]|nr:UvrD-helicase domain-containing protein [Polyangia bacterium]